MLFYVYFYKVEFANVFSVAKFHQTTISMNKDGAFCFCLRKKKKKKEAI